MPEDNFRLSNSLACVLAGEAVRIGTQNQAKVAAVRKAFETFASAEVDLVLVPVEVASGVAEQPIGWDEIKAGARNRAKAAFESGDCALAVGIEDGLVRLVGNQGEPSGGGSEDVFNFGCAWLTDGEREGVGFSSGFAYPKECLGPAMRDQEPIGDLFDALWQSRRNSSGGPATTAPSGRRGGNIGRLTEGGLDRSEYGAQAVICALVRFLHTDLYD